ncbi:MAG: alpha/beta fold hydrolase, partial [Holophagales bacterium]|nr:alpha/beta fold hydrolase [Holophagales bacterium]
MTLPTPGVSTHLEELGAPGGEPVLFLHGNPDSADLWSAVIEHLDGTRYRFLAPDLPGFGRSRTDSAFDRRLSREPLET